LANQRAAAAHWLGLTVDHSVAFTILCFAAAAMKACCRFRMRHIEQPNRAAARLAALSADGKPKLQVVGEPQPVTVSRNEKGRSTAYAITLGAPSGALLFGLCGEEAPSLVALTLRGLMLRAGGPREGVRVTGAECPFEVCFRFPATLMAKILALDHRTRDQGRCRFGGDPHKAKGALHHRAIGGRAVGGRAVGGRAVGGGEPVRLAHQPVRHW
jgi:hypothetical protein